MLTVIVCHEQYTPAAVRPHAQHDYLVLQSLLTPFGLRDEPTVIRFDLIVWS